MNFSKKYGLTYKLYETPNGDFQDVWSDLRNSLYSDVGLSQSQLNTGQQIINATEPALLKAVSSGVPQTTQGTAASAAIQNLTSVFTNNSGTMIITALFIGLGAYIFLRKA